MNLTVKRSSNELIRRYVGFVIVLFVIAFGTSLSIRANLGSSPISCPPYVLSLVPHAYSMGTYVICMHIVFIITQILLLRKNYQKIQLLQILVSVLFGFYTDLTMWMTSFLQVPATMPFVYGYALRFVELFIGGGILAYGIASEVHCDVLMLAGEGFPLAIAKVVKKDFGKVKICSDTGLVCVGVIFMFVFFGGWHWEMIGVGTLISMFYVGFMVRIFSTHFNWLDNFFIAATPKNVAVATSETANRELPFVVTISREYGSGGHEVGEKLAQKLHMDFYDKDLIDKTAEELGYSSEFVAENEQNISTAKLWELIFTDKSIPESMNPSYDDAIYVSQSRTIRELSTKKSCVIIGRLANWILRDDKNSFHVFVTSDKFFAISKIMNKENLNEDEARKKIERINRARSNHYWKYTGGQWTDARNYDLVLNMSKMDVDDAVNLIAGYVQSHESK
jgi:uncharacterized membrane protein YczE/cytidylate kinase